MMAQLLTWNPQRREVVRDALEVMRLNCFGRSVKPNVSFAIINSLVVDGVYPRLKMGISFEQGCLRTRNVSVYKQ